MAVTVYATPEDFFTLGLNREACKSFSVAQISLALDRASREMDGYLRNRYTLPFVSVDDTLATPCCDIAAFRLLKPKGVRPGTADDPFEDAYKAAIQWCKDVRDKEISPQVIDSSAGATLGLSGNGGPRVATASDRGHSTRQGECASGPGFFQFD